MGDNIHSLADHAARQERQKKLDQADQRHTNFRDWAVEIVDIHSEIVAMGGDPVETSAMLALSILDNEAVNRESARPQLIFMLAVLIDEAARGTFAGEGGNK